MYHSKIWQKKKSESAIKITPENITKILQTQVDMAQHFSDVLRKTLKQCLFISNYPQNGHDNWLLFPTYDDELLTIGFIENGNYLLDSDFIYKRIYKFHPKDSPLPEQSKYYSELFHIGILKPYNRFFPKSQCKLRIDGKQRKRYFCIPQSVINLDIHTLHWV